MLEDLNDIERFTQNVTKEEFCSNTMIKKAVCMSFLNIGEIVRILPEELTKRNPDIPWASIVGLRNRTAHGYHSLDEEVIWDIAKNDLKELERVIIQELRQLN